MMHPVDPTTNREHESYPSSGEIKAGWWAVFALAIVVALLVTAVLVFTSDESVPQQPEPPQPTEAPVDPGA